MIGFLRIRCGFFIFFCNFNYSSLRGQRIIFLLPVLSSFRGHSEGPAATNVNVETAVQKKGRVDSCVDIKSKKYFIFNKAQMQHTAPFSIVQRSLACPFLPRASEKNNNHEAFFFSSDISFDVPNLRS